MCHYKSRDQENMSAFYVGQTVRLYPYDVVTAELMSAEDYAIEKRDGNFLTLRLVGATDSRRGKNQKAEKKKMPHEKTILTRVGTIKNPLSEVINPDGYCPCYAYDYDNFLSNPLFPHGKQS